MPERIKWQKKNNQQEEQIESPKEEQCAQQKTQVQLSIMEKLRQLKQKLNQQINLEQKFNQKNQAEKKEIKRNEKSINQEQQNKKRVLNEYKKRLLNNKNKREEDSKQVTFKKQTELINQDCRICLDHIKKQEKIWVCKSCLILTHLKCIWEWVKRTQELNQEVGLSFQCFHCGYVVINQQPEYTCYCSKIQNPQRDNFLEANSCGQICGKKLSQNCEHLCQKICHSGPCQECQQDSQISCFCGQNKIRATCKDINSVNRSCQQECHKLLNCKQHFCALKCHQNDCQSCQIILKNQKCECGKTQKDFLCGEPKVCDQICDKLLECGNHKCVQKCHLGKCQECQYQVKENEHCLCQKKTVLEILERERKNCLEKLPQCNLKCDKVLKCDHKCQKICHKENECDCKESLIQKCKCGKETLSEVCNQRTYFQCNKKCLKQMNCGKHFCQDKCCTKEIHICDVICTKSLQCGHHQCLYLCHKGDCRPCDVKLYGYIYCACWQQKELRKGGCYYETPICFWNCGKILECRHKCIQNCHFGRCSSCKNRVTKKCSCQKNLVENAICSEEALCNNKCNKELYCEHLCQGKCHKDNDCILEQKQRKAQFLQVNSYLNDYQRYQKGCFQKCELKMKCKHNCQEFCHIGQDCDQNRCNAQVIRKCFCGFQQEKTVCKELQKEGKINCNYKCTINRQLKEKQEKKQIVVPLYLYSYWQTENKKLIVQVEQFVNDFYWSELQEKSIYLKCKENDQAKVAISLLFTNFYHIGYVINTQGNQLFLKIIRTKLTLLPKESFSEMIQQCSSKEELKYDLNEKSVQVYFNDTLKKFQIQQLSEIVKEFSYKVVIDIDRNILLYIIDKKEENNICQLLNWQQNRWNSYQVINSQDSNGQSQYSDKQQIRRQKINEKFKDWFDASSSESEQEDSSNYSSQESQSFVSEEQYSESNLESQSTDQENNQETEQSKSSSSNSYGFDNDNKKSSDYEDSFII